VIRAARVLEKVLQNLLASFCGGVAKELQVVKK